ncbi:Uncharacterised protein [Mycobacteroides abscessus subsp. abscessus]|uniref:hypothetical protein n=1 Tax=Mycobacteroides abscessus TaxID=36809 RepID=UPI00092C8B7D|nr:hypothetical protein [Mycobacteroides abscessus]SHU65894.1 Uncharacterised protein [Mycobacteroides abscessus subsp. abscessus]
MSQPQSPTTTLDNDALAAVREHAVRQASMAKASAEQYARENNETALAADESAERAYRDIISVIDQLKATDREGACRSDQDMGPSWEAAKLQGLLPLNNASSGTSGLALQRREARDCTCRDWGDCDGRCEKAQS